MRVAAKLKEQTPDRCLNCGARLRLKFCARCGQGATAERYTFKSLVREIYKKFHSVDATATFRTFKVLTFKPGKFVKRYLDGKRVGYTAPITYFFYFFVLELGVRSVLFALTSNAELGNTAEDNLQAQILTLVSTFFWGALWWLFYRHSRLNLTESIIAAIYFVAQVNLLSIFILILSAPFVSKYPQADNISTFAEIGMTFFYGVFFCRRLYLEPYWKLIPKQFSLTLIFLIIASLVFFFDEVGTERLKTSGWFLGT